MCEKGREEERMTRTKSGAGLTPWQVVLQSAAIHPEWSVEEHRNYLCMEEGISEEYAEGLPIESWLFDREHPAT